MSVTRKRRFEDMMKEANQIVEELLPPMCTIRTHFDSYEQLDDFSSGITLPKLAPYFEIQAVSVETLVSLEKVGFVMKFEAASSSQRGYISGSVISHPPIWVYRDQPDDVDTVQRIFYNHVPSAAVRLRFMWCLSAGERRKKHIELLAAEHNRKSDPFMRCNDDILEVIMLSLPTFLDRLNLALATPRCDDVLRRIVFRYGFGNTRVEHRGPHWYLFTINATMLVAVKTIATDAKAMAHAHFDRLGIIRAIMQIMSTTSWFPNDVMSTVCPVGILNGVRDILKVSFTSSSSSSTADAHVPRSMYPEHEIQIIAVDTNGIIDYLSWQNCVPVSDLFGTTTMFADERNRNFNMPEQPLADVDPINLAAALKEVTIYRCLSPAIPSDDFFRSLPCDDLHKLPAITCTCYAEYCGLIRHDAGLLPKTSHPALYRPTLVSIYRPSTGYLNITRKPDSVALKNIGDYECVWTESLTHLTVVNNLHNSARMATLSRRVAANVHGAIILQRYGMIMAITYTPTHCQIWWHYNHRSGVDCVCHGSASRQPEWIEITKLGDHITNKWRSLCQVTHNDFLIRRRARAAGRSVNNEEIEAADDNDDQDAQA